MEPRLTAALEKLSVLASDERRAEQAKADEAERLRKEKKRTDDEVEAIQRKIRSEIDSIVESINKITVDSGIELVVTGDKFKIGSSNTTRISLVINRKERSYFRVTCGTSCKVFIHQLEPSKYGPYQVDSSVSIPFDEIVTSFLENTLPSDGQ